MRWLFTLLVDGGGRILRAAIARGAVSGEHFQGRWADIGTPERLALAVREFT